MTQILIGTPCYNGWVSVEYTVSMLGLQSELARRGVHFQLEMPSNVSLVTMARNYIASLVLADRSISHLLFIDADLGFDAAQVPRLLAADRDVVAGVYPIKVLNLPAVRQLPTERPVESTYHYAVRTASGEPPDAAGFVRAEYAATGFMLIKRHVLEQMARRYAELKYQHMFVHVTSEHRAGQDHLYALFDTSIDADAGHYLPEDYTFCRRWRTMGGEIWVDVNSRFTHVGQYPHRGDFSLAYRST